MFEVIRKQAKAAVYLLGLAATVLTLNLHAAQARDCSDLVSPQIEAQTALKAQKAHKLRLFTYNMEGLHLRTPDTKRVARHFKDMTDVREEADIILETQPDILILEEISSLESLEYFNQQYLGDRYKPILVPGNDDGNFNIGFLVLRQLDFDVEVRSHKDVQWIDPVDNRQKTLFTRDLPALIFRQQGESQVQFVILGNHAKAPTYRNGDEESIMLRTAQYAAAVDILQNFKAEFGEATPLILAGDFNAPIHQAQETKGLLQIMTDTFDLLPRPPPVQDRITHSYHGNKVVEYHQFDGILVSRKSLVHVDSVQIYRYKDHLGRPRHLPKTQEQRNLQPSDHFPVLTDLQIPIR